MRDVLRDVRALHHSICEWELGLALATWAHWASTYLRQSQVIIISLGKDSLILQTEVYMAVWLQFRRVYVKKNFMEYM